MFKNKLVDYLYDDVAKIFRNGKFTERVNKVVDEKILANDGVDSTLINTRISANNTTQQNIVDNKIETVTDGIDDMVDEKIASNNTTQQSTVDTKITTNNTSQQGIVDTKISNNNTSQQSTVDSKISTNNTTQQGIVDTKITNNNTTQQSTVDSKITSNNTSQQTIVDGKITTNNTAQQTVVDTKITASASAINASIPGTVATAIGQTPLKNLSDVQDYTAANIPNGYFLAWNTSTQQWEYSPGSAAKGSIRLFVAEKASNSSVFYFNAITVTALSSASTNIDTAFMVTTNLLNTVTIDLRSNQAISNSVRIDLYKNASGAAFATATTSIANQTQTLTQYNVVRYTFTGLTLNTYDAIHIKVTPTSNPGEVYGIVTIS